MLYYTIAQVTVLRPHADLTAAGAGASAIFDGIPFCPGHIERRFIVPPLGATWATLALSARRAPRRSAAGDVTFMIAAGQLLPHKMVKETSTCLRVTLGMPVDGAPPTEYVTSFAVVGGVTLEVALAQWWMSLGEVACVQVVVSSSQQ